MQTFLTFFEFFPGASVSGAGPARRNIFRALLGVGY